MATALTTPRFTIVITAYRATALAFEKLRQSLKGQTFRDFEVVVVNNANKYISMLDAGSDIPVCITTIPKRSMAEARNTGLNKARGEFILFMNVNSILPLDALEVFNRAVASGADLYFAGMFGYRSKELVPEHVSGSGAPSPLPDNMRIIRGILNPVKEVCDINGRSDQIIIRRLFLKQKNLKFCEREFYGDELHFVIAALACGAKCYYIGGSCRGFAYGSPQVWCSHRKDPVEEYLTHLECIRGYSRISEYLAEDMDIYRIRTYIIATLAAFDRGSKKRWKHATKMFAKEMAGIRYKKIKKKNKTYARIYLSAFRLHSFALTGYFCRRAIY